MARLRAPESIYLQTNKSVFESGEELWFAATVTDRSSLKLSNRSQVLFVELRSDVRDKAVFKEMYPLSGGLGEGHLLLSDTLTTGTYWLTAFTSNSEKYMEEPVKSVRRIELKKSAVPKVLIQLKYNQREYEEGADVSGHLRILKPGGQPVEGARVQLWLRRETRQLKRQKLESDSTGKVAFQFKELGSLPKTRLIVSVEYDGSQEDFSAPIPTVEDKSVQVEFFPEGGRVLAGQSSMVAFQVKDGRGEPVTIKAAELLMEGEVVAQAIPGFGGMGKVNFLPAANKSYTLRITDPPLAGTYPLPQVETDGIGLKLLRNGPTGLSFGFIGQGKTTDSIHLVIRQRGKVRQIASAKLRPEGAVVNIPLEGFLPGIASAELYNDALKLEASRLVYVSPEKRLHVTANTDQELYGVKEKVTVRFKVTDDQGKTVRSLLRLSLVDEVFQGQHAQPNGMSHFYLSDELMSSAYSPSHYVQNTADSTLDHLDTFLLMASAGDYAWNNDNLSAMSGLSPMTLSDSISVQIDQAAYSREIRKEGDFTTEVQLIGTFGYDSLKSDDQGHFYVTPQVLNRAKGAALLFSLKEPEGDVLSFENAFDLLGEHLHISNLSYDRKTVKPAARNWDKLPQFPNAARKVAGVEVVATQSAYQTHRGTVGVYGDLSKDYVCSFGILNCVNHWGATKPVDGKWYRLNSGNRIRYRLRKAGVYSNGIKGFYHAPDFEEPDYEEKPEEKMLPDFRNTLVWKPRLITDENGEAEISFYTSDIRSAFLGKVEILGANGLMGLGTFKVRVFKQ